MKYLFKKIEQAHSAYFENIIFLGNEICRPTTSEAMEEFESLELSEICKVLEWNDCPAVHNLISERLKSGEGLSKLMLQYDETGFLAQCHLPECSNFSSSRKEGRPTSWRVNPGICEVFWLYATTFDELVLKLEIETECRFMDMVKKETEEPAK